MNEYFSLMKRGLSSFPIPPSGSVDDPHLMVPNQTNIRNKRDGGDEGLIINFIDDDLRGE